MTYPFCSLVNALPKQWGGDANSQQTSVQLAGKLERHNTMLYNLNKSQLLQQCQPDVLRSVTF